MTAYLNIGCGERYLENWTNIDFINRGHSVKKYNILDGIPYSDGSFDAVYHSHLLEHIPVKNVPFFINECYRVLKRNGIIRIAVPDLENIVNEYIIQLNNARNEKIESEKRYEWIKLELLDQLVREKSGGEILKKWSQESLDEFEYIRNRVGHEFLHARNSIDKNKPTARKSNKYLRVLKRYSNSNLWRNKIISLLFNDKNIIEYINIGRFRSSGEVHKWMYDDYSLGKLLRNAGFNKIIRQSAFKSFIPDWEKHQWLDVENGEVRKPDSLFIEAIKE